MSLKPPLRAFVSGVRTARVMTMSSGFLDSLQTWNQLAPRKLLMANEILECPPSPTMIIGHSHLAQRRAWRQVLNDGTDAFDSHCAGGKK